MENSQYHHPTKVISGKDAVELVCDEAKVYGDKALIVIGDETVKKIGLYARVLSLMNICGLHHVTFDGFGSYPTHQDAEKAIQIAKAHQVNFIIAMGGRDVIDIAKAAAMGFHAAHPVWEFYSQRASPPTIALPIIHISTTADTGLAHDATAFLNHAETQIRKEVRAACLSPRFSFIDSSFTPLSSSGS